MNKLVGRILVVLSLVSGLSLLGVVGFNLATQNIEHKITIIPKASLSLASTVKNLPSNFLAVLNQKGPYLPMNILVLGSDTRANQGAGFGNVAGARSDTVMLLHLNAERTAATVISFPRDMWVLMPSCANNQGGSENKFNAVFAYGGPGCTAALVTNITGLAIDHVIVVDFSGFKKIVDAMGGLNVCLANPIDDAKAHIQLPAGQQILDGTQALGLARARYSLADGSDLARIKRQQALVLLAVKQIKSKGTLTNPNQLYKLGEAFASALSVDPGLASLPSLTGLAWQIKDLPLSHIEMMTVPYFKDSFGHYVVDPSIADPIFLALKSDSPVPGATISTSAPSPSPSASHSIPVGPKASPTSTITSAPVTSQTTGTCSHPLF